MWNCIHKVDPMKNILIKANLLALVIVSTIATLHARVYSNDDASILCDVTVSTNSITIGDRLALNIEITYAPDMLITSFDPSAQLQMFEIKDFDTREPRKKSLFSKKMQKAYTYILSTFTIGEYEIPAMTLTYSDGTKEDTVTTNSIAITVTGVEKREGDHDDIRDIKGIMSAHYPLWIRIGIAIVFICLIIIGYAFYLHKTCKIPAFLLPKEKPKEPAHIVALRALDQLDFHVYLEKGEIKHYYIALSDIIRKYIEDHYGVDILEKTTFEIYHSLRDLYLSKKLLLEIKEFLDECDLVKFAKYLPSEADIERDYKTAYNIVEETKPKHEEEDFEEGELVE
jgi:hypothetical protein